MKEWLRAKLKRFVGIDDLRHLRKVVIELNDVRELMDLYGWTLPPILDDAVPQVHGGLTDVNQRRLRDAESLAAVVRNVAPAVCLDIGTGRGYSAALMALNAPQATVHTVNIPPEQFAQGGVLATMKLERDEIGDYYRQRGLTNIRQIYANTTNLTLDFGPIDVAFIDGSHDTEFVINDTIKVLAACRSGSYILWHDFNPSLVHVFRWIDAVCRGVDTLFARSALTGHVFHLRDSWVGLCQVRKVR